MSRIGKLPISVPNGVKIGIKNNEVLVQGPKGELTRSFSPDMTIKLEENEVIVERPSDNQQHKSLHGLTRALINNMVTGVSTGFTSELEIQGVGYRAQMEGNNLVLNVGYSHPIIFEPEDGLGFEVDKTGRNLVVKGIDKERVGEIAARIRRTRPPEPYKGKGVRYKGEIVRRKAGKAGKK